MIGDRRHMRKARYVGKLKDRLWTGAPALTAEGALADGKIERRPRLLKIVLRYRKPSRWVRFFGGFRQDLV
jgi:hypothetical protein